MVTEFLRVETGEHQVGGEGQRKIIIDWDRPGDPIEGVPGSHYTKHLQSTHPPYQTHFRQHCHAGLKGDNPPLKVVNKSTLSRYDGSLTVPGMNALVASGTGVASENLVVESVRIF